jgi:molecular chaperone GrpE
MSEEREPQPEGAAGQDPAAGAGGVTIEIEDSPVDLDAAMRDALAAVEAVEAVGAVEVAEGVEAAKAGDPPPGDPPAAAAAGQGNPAELATLRREIADLRDRSMRTLADFDNFRKRTDRERQETRRYALLEPLREFLPIADNLDRALSAGGAAEDLKRGVEMIARQMQDLLRRFGVREVPAAGEVFNPAVHEAVARTESDTVAVPTVAEELVRGYMLHDRLLRPAMVKVAVPSEKAAGAAGPADNPGASNPPSAAGAD